MDPMRLESDEPDDFDKAEIWRELEAAWAKRDLGRRAKKISPNIIGGEKDVLLTFLGPLRQGMRGDRLTAILPAINQLITEAVRAREADNYQRAENLLMMARSELKGGAFNQLATDVPAWRTQLVLVQLELVETLYRQGAIRRAIALVEEGLGWTRAGNRLIGGLPPERVRFLLHLAELYTLRGHLSMASERVDLALEILDGAAWPDEVPKAHLRATALRVRGTVKARGAAEFVTWQSALMDFDLSLAEAEQAAERDQELSAEDLLLLEAYVEREKCRLYTRSGNLVAAVSHCGNSYNLRTTCGHGRRALALYHSDTADISRAFGDLVSYEMLDALLGALETFSEIGDALNVARMHIRLSRYYRKDGAMGRPREARYWAQRALAFAKQEHIPLIEALALRQLGLAKEKEAELLHATVMFRNPSFSNAKEAGAIDIIDTTAPVMTPEQEKRFRKIINRLHSEATNDMEKSISALEKVQDRFELAGSQRAYGVMLGKRARRVRKDDELSADQDLERAKEFLDKAASAFLVLDAKIELKKTQRMLNQLMQPSNAREDSIGG